MLAIAMPAIPVDQVLLLMGLTAGAAAAGGVLLGIRWGVGAGTAEGWRAGWRAGVSFARRFPGDEGAAPSDW